MTTLSVAEKKWERKMEGAGSRWKRHINPDAFARGMAQFLGIGAISSDKLSAYTSGTGAVSEADFSAAVRGKGTKWAEKLKAAFS